ncbi:uncharacterized protein BX664DRAFT_317334 [Halteromyces radiatus]|uniref:uncharacterized protein n=1 Tax=Halteromyces radiatus TaxID=101107 RepID=UPI00221FFE93|nr:uncharacterized protein BX664DRAFT_317334 [Halteromyces radiatus]KAI8081447.1 hypothetical protein BX664DRAFT_317334 [Halteromyces radiatus]
MITHHFFSSISIASSCTPSNCIAQCQPSCSDDQVCVLGTMSNCGQCPASKCMSKEALGLSPSDSNSNNGQDNNNNDNNDNGALIGGLVGGLLGGGILVGGLVYCIFQYRKKSKTTLPIAFHTTTRLHKQQQQQQHYNHHNSLNDFSDIPRPMSENTRDSTCHSITSGVIPIAYIPPSYHIQQEAYYQQQQRPHSSSSSSSTNSYMKSNQPWTTSSTATPHATSSNTAVENPFQDPRHSQYSIDDDDDDDMSSKHHSMISTTQTASHHAVQVTRAKPQILRVNTVRDLKRGDSVRTILTKSDDLSRSNTLELKNPSSNGQQDPFQDDRYTVENDDDEQPSSRPVTNHSLGSTVGDGEITIFWSGQQPFSSH